MARGQERYTPAALARKFRKLDEGYPGEYVLVRGDGEDESGEPLWSADGALEALEDREPGAYGIQRVEDGTMLASALINEHGERVTPGMARRGTPDVVMHAIGRSLSGAGETFMLAGQLQQQIIRDERNRIHRLEAKVEEQTAIIEALKDELRAASQEGPENELIELVKEAIQVFHGSKFKEKAAGIANRILPKLPPQHQAEIAALLAAELEKA